MGRGRLKAMLKNGAKGSRSVGMEGQRAGAVQVHPGDKGGEEEGMGRGRLKAMLKNGAKGSRSVGMEGQGAGAVQIHPGYRGMRG